MDKFTVEEVNLMCVFEGQDRMCMIADIKNVIPHIQETAIWQSLPDRFWGSWKPRAMKNLHRSHWRRWNNLS